MTLFPGLLWGASKGLEESITLEMISNAARLAGFDWSEADRRQMLAGLQANLASYEELRGLKIDQSVAPPLYFNPAVPGQAFSNARQPFRLGRRPSIKRPERLEDLAYWPVTQLAQLIETKQVSATELTSMFLDRIRKFDPLLRAVITVTEDRALRQAKAADDEIARGHYRGTLHGIPWGAKDLLAARGYRTTWGFKAYENQVIDLDATVVQRLDAAGAILIAKLSTGEIARGDYWLGVQTRNPWKTSEGADGSSAGPASATAPDSSLSRLVRTHWVPSSARRVPAAYPACAPPLAA